MFTDPDTPTDPAIVVDALAELIALGMTAFATLAVAEPAT